MPTVQLNTVAALGAISGILLKEGGFHEIHEAIEKLCGYPVWTHQLPRVFNDIKAKFADHPVYSPIVAEIKQAAEMLPDEPTPADRNAFFASIDAIVKRIGPTMDVEMLEADDTEKIHPMDGIRDVVNKNAVIIPVTVE